MGSMLCWVLDAGASSAQPKMLQSHLFWWQLRPGTTGITHVSNHEAFLKEYEKDEKKRKGKAQNEILNHYNI